MSSSAVLEVIALDATDARAAERGGADRLELVTDMAADGLTPSRETFAAVREAVRIPVRVMLRLRPGFGVGDSREQDELVARARELRAVGAEEFVLGFLDATGGPDLKALDLLLAELDGCRWTFHRALDQAVDRHALRVAVAPLPGLDTYLTAGSPTGVDDGMSVLLAEAMQRGEPGYEQHILVGGGLRLDHMPRLLAAGVNGFHIGTAARPHGWDGPVHTDTVLNWRRTLDT
ncbi:copper homeostasis protein CutC [Streptomyces sp. NA04227]|uniref:copper homeostasis protein CutC n=1 Tax=Streptomyces sp. NA04227 TaxID=2742136 RepID=UPI0015916938|nr:copper homeostasis protein CutC [Streptomyces sp. NA04227]QKW08303.1 copper homeostasis protein CutC [Streptomyces sp. NA04227]